MIASTTIWAAEMPSRPNFYFFTIGPNIPVNGADWYSSTGGGDGYHYALIDIPCSWTENQTSDQAVDIDLFSPEINLSTTSLDLTPDTNNHDTTTFELYGPNVDVTLPDQPGPGAAGSIHSVTYDPSSDAESWVRFYSIPAPVACGQYVLRIQTEINDVNAWLLRVGLDDNDDATDEVPATFDALPGTEDRIALSTMTNVTAYVSPDMAGGVGLDLPVCTTVYQYVAPGQESVSFNNFDLNQLVGDPDANVQYFSPSQVNPFGLNEENQEEADASAAALWNNNPGGERSGDVFENPESGWWHIVTCASSGNRYIQEGQQNEPIYWTQPPTPDLVLTLSSNTDGSTMALGDTIDYAVDISNSIEGTPGVAYNLAFTQTLPSGTTFQNCALEAGLSGECTGDGTTVNIVLDSVGINADAAVNVQAELVSTAGSSLVSTISGNYADVFGHAFFAEESKATVVLGDPPAIAMTISNGQDGVQPGEIVTNTIQVSNTGKLAAPSVQISYTLPSDVTLLNISDNGFELNGVIFWAPVDILGGTSVERTVVVQVAQKPTFEALSNIAGVSYLDTSSNETVGIQSIDQDQQVSSFIEGRVWQDVNNNGSFDVGEPGIPDVVVTILSPSTPDSDVVTTTTDLSGQYRSPGLGAGDYMLTFDTRTLQPGFTQSGSNPVSLTLGEAETRSDVNLGFWWPSSVSGIVWHELTQDGVLNDDEFTLAGIDVILVDENDVEITRTQTLSDGIYLFSNLNGGSYTINVDTTGYPVELTPSHDPDFTADATTNVIIMGSGGLSQINFGYISYGAIGGTVWNDTNGDGAVDGDEASIADVTLLLVDRDGTQISSTVSSDTGEYRFDPVRLDAYEVQVDTATLPAGVVGTYEIDNNPDSMVALTLTDPREQLDVNFGFATPGTIADSRIWQDLNNDGLFDQGEPPLVDVTVQLIDAGNDGALATDDDVVISTTTALDGSYGFANLAPGLYRLRVISETVPVGLQLGGDPDNLADGVTEVMLELGETVDNLNFTYISLDLAILLTDFDFEVPTSDIIPYRIFYTNTSAIPAAQVIVTEIIPENTIFQPFSSHSQWICENGDVTGGTECILELGSLDANASGFITFTVMVSDVMPANVDVVTNTVSIADVGISAGGGNQSTETTPILASPNLQVRQSDGRIRVNPGDPLVYEIEYSNTGTQGTTGVLISQRVPVHASFNATLSTDGWSCEDAAPANTLCTFLVGDLPAQASGVISFATNVEPSLPVNIATIDGLVTITDDNGGTDDDFEVTPVDSAPDLLIDHNDPDAVSAGQLIVYTLSYTNAGNQDAVGVLIVETVPANTTFDLQSSTPGWDCANNSPAGTNCIFTIGSLLAGRGGAIEFAVTVRADLPEGVTGIENSAVIAGSGIEQDIANNQFTVNTTINQNGQVVDQDGEVVDDVQDPLVIELLSFTANATDEGIYVRWETGSEIDTWGFLLYRSTDGTWDSAVRATPSLIESTGNENTGVIYTFEDKSVLNRISYTYWLQELETTGVTNIYGPIQSSLEAAVIPGEEPNEEPTQEPDPEPVPVTVSVFLPVVTR
ncbi:MAG: SdrD B-like domain-containing protein [Chloroflexota bacterium]